MNAHRLLRCLSIAAAAALAAPAAAAPTRQFVTTSFKNFEAGEAQGVLLTSAGEISPGPGARRVEMPVAFVRSALVLPGSSAKAPKVLLGTGDDGEVWILEGQKARKLVQVPGAVEITALTPGPTEGEVYVGSIPGGRVHAIKVSDGKVREVAKLDAEHVWAMSYDASRRELWVGTGSPGKLYAIDAGGKSRLVWDSKQRHVRSLALADGGDVLVGTSPDAILYRVSSKGQATALHDFEGEEIRALARFGGSTYVAVNAFQVQPPAAPAASGPASTRITPPPATASRKPSGSTQRPGKAAVWRMDARGRVEQVHAIGSGYFTALHVEPSGDVLVGSAESGKVYLVKPDRTLVTLFDFAERQVLAFAYANGTRVLATGDAGAVYVASDARSDATYLSEVYSTEFPARFGKLRWRGRGQVVAETRTGMTAKPDTTWSAWAPVKGDGDKQGQVVSPEGRYYQYRLKLGAGAAVREVATYWRAQNQPPRVVEVTAGHPGGVVGPSAVLTGAQRPGQVRIAWRIENPDNDTVSYRVYFREDDEKNWRPLGGTDPIVGKQEYLWNTEGVPDGHYVVRVVASDEPSNPAADALSHELQSETFLVDNRAPEVADLRVQGGVVSGEARDGFSPISDLAYSVDGGEWKLVSPSDGLFDDRRERFSFRAPERLGAGAHVVAVRAVDAAGNLAASSVQVRVK